MPDDTRCAHGSVVGDLLSVATLLKNPQLTGLYAYLYREEPATVREVMNALDFSRETTQTLLSRLEEMGTVETLSDDEPQKYRALVVRDLGDDGYGSSIHCCR
ncbi:MAG: putative transcriptional regulator [Haloquadratum sp. J07HQX50]|jgi:Sugar-specific transcriptional regulator TrmB.|uniref:Putative transcriptional regulator n=1 Tax=Haloquadratum walsbyi J07HQW1 TaxID=1238424 RepID=U1MPA1_9EURY|nr:MAG: putative transcriptional regulator [Haloquadratum walsbyi J07HQW1]ERG98941.1 MAG: putative transcriptional regulator [Haloquadratum sp. J07HQX50]